jgi:hypothetical protein
MQRPLADRQGRSENSEESGATITEQGFSAFLLRPEYGSWSGFFASFQVGYWEQMGLRASLCSLSAALPMVHYKNEPLVFSFLGNGVSMNPLNV